MARVNIEDSIYRDARFQKLIIIEKDRFRAMGICIAAWTLAQYWFAKSPTGFIPFQAWEESEIPDSIFECKLASREDGGIYVRGAKEHCEWLKQRAVNGGKGGALSVISRKAKYGTSEPCVSEIIEEVHEAKRSKFKQNEASYSFSVFSDSAFAERNSQPKINNIYSFDHSGEPTDRTTDSEFSEKKEPKKSKSLARENTSSEVKNQLEEIYKCYPRKLGKASGMKKLLIAARDPLVVPRIKKAVENYARYVTKNSVEMQYVKHFSSFASCWADWEAPDESALDDKMAPKAPRDLSIYK